MGNNELKLFCTVTEFSRISGIPKKSLYNKEGKGTLSLVDVVRRGRRKDITERCIGFDDMCKLWPTSRGYVRFDFCYQSELISLFQTTNNGIDLDAIGGGLAFSIIELVRMLDLSKQAIHGRINSGKVTKQKRRRNFRNFDERLILGSDLKKIKDEPFNVKDRILELFMEKN